MALLESMDDPSRIRELDDAQLEQLCAELREYIIRCCAENPGHVGMYIGNGEYIQAPKTGDVVKISKLSGRSDYVGARRYY